MRDALECHRLWMHNYFMPGCGHSAFTVMFRLLIAAGNLEYLVRQVLHLKYSVVGRVPGFYFSPLGSRLHQHLLSK